MFKAIGSRVRFNDDNEVAIEFRTYISDLLEYDEVKKLTEFHQHCNTTRLQHCYSVSYYSFLFAKLIGANPRSAARAGLLHDLFWYDWRKEKTPQLHAFYHPKAALINAEKMLGKLKPCERDAIVKHMWPLCMGIPKYRESIAVTMADKYCASIEVVYQWGKVFIRKISVGFYH